MIPPHDKLLKASISATPALVDGTYKIFGCTYKIEQDEQGRTLRMIVTLPDESTIELKYGTLSLSWLVQHKTKNGLDKSRAAFDKQVDAVDYIMDRLKVELKL